MRLMIRTCQKSDICLFVSAFGSACVFFFPCFSSFSFNRFVSGKPINLCTIYVQITQRENQNAVNFLKANWLKSYPFLKMKIVIHSCFFSRYYCCVLARNCVQEKQTTKTENYARVCMCVFLRGVYLYLLFCQMKGIR